MHGLSHERLEKREVGKKCRGARLHVVYSAKDRAALDLFAPGCEPGPRYAQGGSVQRNFVHLVFSFLPDTLRR